MGIGKRSEITMKLAAGISIALAISGLPPALAATEQCRFIEARLEREACYQRQETARAAGPVTQADRPRPNSAGPDEIGEPTMAHPPHAAPGV